MSRVLQNLLELVDRMRTNHELVARLNEFGDIPHEEQMYVLGMIQSVPALAQIFLAVEAPKMAEGLPPLPPGRKLSLTLKQRIQVIDFISDLFKGGIVPLQTCKEQAALRFCVSLRSIERVWRKRSEINQEKPNIPLDELIAWMSKS